MCKTYLMIFAALVSTSLVAQTVTNAPASPPIEAPAASVATTNVTTTNTATTNPPTAKKASKKKSEKKAVARKKAPAAPLVTTPLNPGPAVCEANNVNVRGQAKLKSEVVGKLTKGQQVTVLEEVHLKNSGPEEPSAWAKILLPTNTLVWINTSFIDSANKTIKPKKLNIRTGPGENYSVIGTLKQGDPVKDISTKGDWTQIEAPADAFAFVAAQFLKQGEAVPIVAANTPTTTTPTPEPNTPPSTTTTVTEPQIATSTDPVPVPAAPPATTPPPSTNEPPVTTTEPSETTTNTPSEDTEPPPKRIVQREGIVRGTFSIQAPTKYELISPDNRRTINYLHSDSPDLDLSRYKGLRIIITGEEGLDERWRNTPVITIQKIQVLDYGG